MRNVIRVLAGSLVLASCAGSVATGRAADNGPEPDVRAEVLLASSRPSIETFLASLDSDQDKPSQDVTTADFRVVRFPEGSERLTIQQLKQMIDGCKRSENFQANSVAVSVFFTCQDRPSPRLVFNFQNGKISRISAGVLEPLRVGPRVAPGN